MDKADLGQGKTFGREAASLNVLALTVVTDVFPEMNRCVPPRKVSGNNARTRPKRGVDDSLTIPESSL